MVATATSAPPAGSHLVRWSGLCWMTAGVMIASLVTHPDIFDATLAEAALETPFWTEMHALGLVSAVLLLFGLVGLYARQAGRIGGLGLIGVGLAVPGLVLTACLAYFEAFVMPVVARTDPAVLDWDGPLLRAWDVRITGGLALTWPLGVLLLGIATWRANVLPRGAAATLAVGAPTFAAFEGPFLPVLGAASVVIFAVGHVWLGYALWSTRGVQSRTADRARTARRRRS